MAAYLLDTNVVLRLIDREAPEHRVCQAAVEALITREEELCLAPQVLVEFWVAATRPVSANGYGWDPDFTDGQIGLLCGLFRLRPERNDIFPRWRELVRERAVRGKRAHDARLAAFVIVHDIDAVITLNSSDFRGFGVSVLEPDEIS